MSTKIISEDGTPLPDRSDLLIEDIFFNLVDQMHIEGYLPSVTSRNHISKMAGVFSKTLKDCGIVYSPKDIREDYFERL